MSVQRLRKVWIVGILTVAALVASACAATDTNDAQTADNGSTATTRPGSTTTPQPTPRPTQAPTPALNQNDAILMRVGETVGSRFNILYPDLHFYKVRLEEGTTYTFDLTDTLGTSMVSISVAGLEPLANNLDSDLNRASRLVWTAPGSDTYIVKVFGAYTNNYTLTVTGGETASSQTPAQTTMPYLSPTPRPRPGDFFGNALTIGLGEVASYSFPEFGLGSHFYQVQLEEGTTYTVDILDTLRRSFVALSTGGGRILAFNTESAGGLASRIEWTADRSGPHIVIVTGSGDGSYTFTVTDPNTARAQTPVQTTTPGISPTPDTPPTAAPSGAALTFASETCSAVVPPDDAGQECSLEVVGPGRFTASIRADRDEGFGWRVQVNAARRLPEAVVCNRTQGVGDGDVICEVPEGVRTTVEIGGQLKGKVGGGTPTGITINVNYSQYQAPTAPESLVHSALCSTGKPLRTSQRCSVHVIGPGIFTASIRTGRDVGFRWGVQVNSVRNLPDEVICNRTQGVGDGDITCEVPEGTRTEVEIEGTLLSGYGNASSNEIAIQADFLQHVAPPTRLAHSAVCSAVVSPATHQKCSVHAIGPGRFTAAIRAGNGVPYDWRVQVNAVKRLPAGVVCNRTEGVGDGNVTCEVPAGVRTEVEIGGQLKNSGTNSPAEITIEVEFLK